MNEDARREVGLFRYALVRDAADPGLTKAERGRLVGAVAGREHLGPDGRLVWVSATTLRRWIRAYRHGGFQALVPQPRVTALRTSAESLELAFALKRERPERTAAQVREIMLATAGEKERVPGLRTLQTHLARQGLNVRGDGRAPGKVYGRFEAGRATSYGPGMVCMGRCSRASRHGGRCCWRSSMIRLGCWSAGGGAPVRTCSG
jgi:putative transposase